MKKVSLCLMATIAVICAGTAFVAYSIFDHDPENEGFLGRIVGGTTRAAGVVADVPEKTITGEPMGTHEEPGVLGTVVTGAGGVAADISDVPQNVIQGNYRNRRYYDDVYTNIEAQGPLFEDVPADEETEYEIEEEVED